MGPRATRLTAVLVFVGALGVFAVLLHEYRAPAPALPEPPSPRQPSQPTKSAETTDDPSGATERRHSDATERRLVERTEPRDPPFEVEAPTVVRVTVRPILRSGEASASLRLLASLDGPFGLRRDQSVDLPRIEEHVFAFPTTGTIHVTGVHPSAVGERELVASRPGDYEVDLVMDPATRVRGIVVDAETGLPLEGAEVQTYDREDAGLPPVTTDAAGEFEIGPWPLDVLTGLKVRREKYGPEVVKLEVEADGSWRVPARFGYPEVRGSNRAYVDVHLLAEKVVQGTLASVGGDPQDVTVVARGLYLVKANVMATDERAGSPDGAGRFRLEGLRSDIRHGIVLRGPGGVATFTAPAMAGTFDLGQVELSEPSRLSGTVLGSDLRPIAGARLTLRRVTEPTNGPEDVEFHPDGGANRNRDVYGWHLQLAEWEAYTDNEGRFTFEGVDRGPCRLRVRVMGRTVARRDVEIRGFGEQLEPLLLSREIPEVLVDVSGTPEPASATVQIAEAGKTDRLALFRPGSDGFFHARGLRTDRPYVARLMTEKGEAFDARFVLAEGQERLRLRFEAAPASR